MRKTVALLLGAATVVALATTADARPRRHHYRPVVQDSRSDGSRFVAAALHQLVVPLEVTFAPSAPAEPRYYRRHRHRR